MVEAAGPADMDDLREVAELLGDPQPDVGRAGDDGRIGMLLIEVGDAVDRRRRGEEAVAVADEDVVVVGEEAEEAGGLGGIGGEMVAARRRTGGERRLDDRPIAGAAAEIAGDPVGHRVAVERPRIGRLIEGEQAHDEAGRAEAALRGVALDHRGLHRMELALRADKVLDRDDLGAVDLAEELDAGVDRLVDQPAVAEPADGDRAGAAVALAAALLGALRPLRLAEIVEEERRRLDVGELDHLALADEADRLAHRRAQLPR